MPTILVPNTASVQMIYTNGISIWENTYNVAGQGAWDLAALQSLATTFSDWERGTASGVRSLDVQCIRIVATDLSQANGEQYTEQLAVPINGNLQSPVMPGNVTLAITLRSSQRGRSHRGRIYLIGLSEIQCTKDQVASTALPSILQDYQALLTLNYPNTGVLVVVSRYSGKLPNGKPAPRPVGIVSAIEAITADPYLDSQRRRLQGRGN